MTLHYRIFLYFTIILWSIGQLQGQSLDEWEGRPGIAIEHAFDNGIEARIRYRHTLDNNMRHYKESAFEFKIDYRTKINSWLEPSIDYRYKYNGKHGFHDIRYSVKIEGEIWKNLELEYSPKLQQIIAAGENPEFYVRNKIQVAYLISKPWSIFIFSENYQSVNGGIKFDAQKDGLGMEYEINKTNELEFKMDIKNNSTHEDIGRLTLSYTYIIE